MANNPPDFDQDDQLWLDTLAGKTSDSPHDPVLHGLAQSLRNALIQQDTQIDQEVATAMAAGINPSLNRLRSEGLLAARSSNEPLTPNRYWIWPGAVFAGAIAIILGLNLLLPQTLDQNPYPQISAQDEASMSMRVDNPKQHAFALAALIRSKGSSVHIRHLPNGHVMLYADANPGVMELMHSHNMTPMISGKMLIVAFVPMNDPHS